MKRLFFENWNGGLGKIQRRITNILRTEKPTFWDIDILATKVYHPEQKNEVHYPCTQNEYRSIRRAILSLTKKGLVKTEPVLDNQERKLYTLVALGKKQENL